MLASAAGFGATLAYGLFSLLSFSAQIVPIPQENIRAPQELGNIELCWTPNGFILSDGYDKYFIEPALVDKEIRDFDNRQMMYWLGLAKDIKFKGQTLTLFKQTHQEFQELMEEVSQEAEVRGISEQEASAVKAQLAGQGGYLEVVRYDDGSFGIHAHQRLPGGGPLGGKIGFWAGYFGTHILAQGAIIAVSGAVTLVCPPAGTAVFLGLQTGGAPVIQGTAMAMGLAGGITGAVVTGPV